MRAAPAVGGVEQQAPHERYAVSPGAPRVRIELSGFELVGVIGFEPTTPSSRTRCATRLRYTPTPARHSPQRVSYRRACRGEQGQACRAAPISGIMIRQGAKAGVGRRKRCAPGSFPPTRENALRQLRRGKPRFMVRPPARAVQRKPGVGASPSGKAVDFDSTMRRFESSRPSHAFSIIGPNTGLRRKAGVAGDFRLCVRLPDTRRLKIGLLRSILGPGLRSPTSNVRNFKLASVETGSIRAETGLILSTGSVCARQGSQANDLSS